MALSAEGHKKKKSTGIAELRERRSITTQPGTTEEDRELARSRNAWIDRNYQCKPLAFSCPKPGSSQQVALRRARRTEKDSERGKTRSGPQRGKGIQLLTQARLVIFLARGGAIGRARASNPRGGLEAEVQTPAPASTLKSQKILKIVGAALNLARARNRERRRRRTRYTTKRLRSLATERDAATEPVAHGSVQKKPPPPPLRTCKRVFEIRGAYFSSLSVMAKFRNCRILEILRAQTNAASDVLGRRADRATVSCPGRRWTAERHLDIRECRRCRDPGSNRRPSDLQSDGLPTELSRLDDG